MELGGRELPLLFGLLNILKKGALPAAQGGHLPVFLAELRLDGVERCLQIPEFFQALGRPLRELKFEFLDAGRKRRRHFPGPLGVFPPAAPPESLSLCGQLPGPKISGFQQRIFFREGGPGFLQELPFVRGFFQRFVQEAAGGGQLALYFRGAFRLLLKIVLYEIQF